MAKPVPTPAIEPQPGAIKRQLARVQRLIASLAHEIAEGDLTDQEIELYERQRTDYRKWERWLGRDV